MPTIEVDLDDIYHDLDRCEIESLLDWLHEDGHLEPYVKKLGIDTHPVDGLTDDTFTSECASLAGCYYRMTPEEIETVRGLAAKYKFH